MPEEINITPQNKEKLLNHLESLLKEDNLYEKLQSYATYLLDQDPNLNFDDLYSKIHEYLINNIPSTIHDKFYNAIKNEIKESEQK
ncbi:hypothetical protein SLOPH_2743 [Spraguea lophii 42_110]|uniref:Uncharacterized protein n=1 Tax=Spraguea lophii (strain 42_110) TaxID=1358809 RepID=S7W9H8_SPRLO|nr:hypothetical protein SLOPH_2743 [Spraguea lophii 42_110]